MSDEYRIKRLASLHRAWLALAVSAWTAVAVEPPTNSARETITTPDLPFRQIGERVFRLGSVTLDQQKRTVSFPAAVNLRKGVVEYALVTTRGKIHESLFRTETEPLHIHLALLLLNARPAGTNAFPDDLSSQPPGDLVTVEVRWRRFGRQITRPLESCVISATTGRPLAAGPWVYNGSFVAGGRFVAQLDGSIVALQIDPNALINNPRPGREDDTYHHGNNKVLPPEDAPVEITIRLTQSDTPGTVTHKKAKPASTRKHGAPKSSR